MATLFSQALLALLFLFLSFHEMSRFVCDWEPFGSVPPRLSSFISVNFLPPCSLSLSFIFPLTFLPGALFLVLGFSAPFVTLCFRFFTLLSFYLIPNLSSFFSFYPVIPTFLCFMIFLFGLSVPSVPCAACSLSLTRRIFRFVLL